MARLPAPPNSASSEHSNLPANSSLPQMLCSARYLPQAASSLEPKSLKTAAP